MPLDFNPFHDDATCGAWLVDYEAVIPGVGLIDIKVSNDEQAKLACPTATIITRKGYFYQGVERSRKDYLMSLDSESEWTVKTVWVFSAECPELVGRSA